MPQPFPILTMPARLQLRVLSEEGVARLHGAALELLGAAGPAAAEAAREAPGTFVLGGRAPECDVVVGARLCWLAAGGAAARVRPRAGGQPRPATGADLEEACRLADALPEVALLAGPPVRVAGETALGELARCLATTGKHVQVTTLRTAAEASAAVRMALAVAGGSATELRRRPIISLRGAAEALGAASVFARAGLPVGVVATPNSGGGAGPRAAAGGGPAADGPDLATALARHHAGVLAACAAIQAAAPGAPFFYLADPALAGLAAGGPEAAMFQIAAAQLAGLVDIPVIAAGMAGGSHAPDWQACTQSALASLSTTAARCDITAGAGLLDGGATFSAQNLVMDCEIFSWNATVAGGIEVSDDTIALDVIESVGRGGNYLAERHTRRHMKEVWRPRLLDRSPWDAWVAAGRQGAYEKATALAERLLAEQQVTPLGDEVSGVLARIVAEAGL